MPKLRTLELRSEERAKLEDTRDHDPTPYLRERAAAIIKIANGRSPHWVAKNGLLKQRHPDTVYRWLNQYEADGLDGLYMEEGGGRKPAFPSQARLGG